jgi:TatD DNase family protein
MTFHGSKRIRQLAATLPLSSLVLETDSPDIRPQWAQSYPNRPANVAAFAQVLAELRNEPVADIAYQTTANARALFGING